MKKISPLLLVLLVSWLIPLQAGPLEEADEKIRAALKKYIPNLQPDTIAETGLNNLYEVTFGTQIVYVDGKGRYLVNGDVFDFAAGESITQQRGQQLKATALAKLDEKDMIVYGDKNAAHTITVFTDIECGYCRKLHSEMAQYNAEGIRVRYLAFPRAGVPSDAAKKAESVWCAKDRNLAMTQAKSGETVEDKTCKNPVAEQYKLGQQFGIRGTPALVLDDGEVLPGYMPPKRLKQALAKRVASKQ